MEDLIMKMFSKRDVECIVEEFIATHFGFDSVSLNTNSRIELKTICEYYGVEVPNMVEQ